MDTLRRSKSGQTRLIMLCLIYMLSLISYMYTHVCMQITVNCVYICVYVRIYGM